MGNLRRFARVLALSACLVATTGHASGDSGHLEESGIVPGDIHSLQRGARNFMNYCSGCHSARYVRYNTIGKYLELSEQQLIDSLMFNAEKTFETIRASMPADDAARWFGKTPPDLSLMSRSKGADYIYNFLTKFYVAEDSATGVNNLMLDGTSMPHVLWELQGYQAAKFITHENADGSVTTTFKEFEQISPGLMNAEEYAGFVRDTVNFLAHIGEPIRSDRRKLGVWVLMFLFFFYIIASMLKKQIWKDVN